MSRNFDKVLADKAKEKPINERALEK